MDPLEKTGVVTDGLTVINLETGVDAPLQPLATTLTFTVPVNPLAQVKTPEELIIPAAELSMDQVKLVLLVAVVK